MALTESTQEAIALKYIYYDIHGMIDENDSEQVLIYEDNKGP